jgi:serine/threonine protein kinase
LDDVREKGGVSKGIVYMHQKFIHKEPRDGEHVCLVFETLGKSLYDFIKTNGYKGKDKHGRDSFVHVGFCLKQIQSFAKQSLVALEFLHKMKLTHTDLKVSQT